MRGRRQTVIDAGWWQSIYVLLRTLHCSSSHKQTLQFKKLEQYCHQMQCFTHPRFSEISSMISAIDDFQGPKMEFIGQQAQDKWGIDHSIFMKWSLSSQSLFTAENDVTIISLFSAQPYFYYIKLQILTWALYAMLIPNLS